MPGILAGTGSVCSRQGKTGFPLALIREILTGPQGWLELDIVEEVDDGYAITPLGLT